MSHTYRNAIDNGCSIDYLDRDVRLSGNYRSVAAPAGKRRERARRPLKKAYVFGLLVISLALGFSLWAFTNSLSPFVDIKTARAADGPVQVRGLIVKDAEHAAYYDPASKAFRFWIVDKNKDICQVVYHGAKPDAFDAAPGLSASGVMARDASGHEFFNSDSLSVQCPSKYNSYKVDYSKKPSAGGPV